MAEDDTPPLAPRPDFMTVRHIEDALVEVDALIKHQVTRPIADRLDAIERPPEAQSTPTSSSSAPATAPENGSSPAPSATRPNED